MNWQKGELRCHTKWNLAKICYKTGNQQVALALWLQTKQAKIHAKNYYPKFWHKIDSSNIPFACNNINTLLLYGDITDTAGQGLSN